MRPQAAIAALMLAPAIAWGKPTPSCEGAVVRAKPVSLREAAQAANAYFALPPGLLAALVDTENQRWDVGAVGSFGEVGLAQMKPTTVLVVLNKRDTAASRKWAAWVLFQPRANLCLAARLLADNLAACAGNTACAVACYNAGPGNCRYTASILARLEPAKE